MSWTTGINCLSPVQYWVKVGALALSNLFKKCSYGDSRVLGYFHWGEWFVFLFSNTFEYLFRGSSDLFQASETFFLLTDKILQFTVIEMDFPGLSRLSFYPFFFKYCLYFNFNFMQHWFGRVGLCRDVLWPLQTAIRSFHLTMKFLVLSVTELTRIGVVILQ